MTWHLCRPLLRPRHRGVVVVRIRNNIFLSFFNELPLSHFSTSQTSDLDAKIMCFFGVGICEIEQMNNNGPAATNGLAELSHGLQEENKEIRDGVMGEGQGLSEEDESQINEDDGGINDGCGEVAQAVSQRSKQQSQGPLVCWGRFLPLRSLKVLLVENDDSTRHVVCALLRNSGYEVMAASDALQAWKLLEDLTNHFDLVLTEVVMPCLTGFGLLCKIKRHKTLRNIPVITMSSHCSMSVVFKCLSKGAADFLVKPIRKNELKNLWQHVWRKCHSASGSGSENAVRTQKSTESKSADQSNNKTSSNGEDDNGSIGLNLRDGSDHGSGTQSSWTKGVVEVDSPKSMSPWNHLADHPDSTSARVIHSTEQACVNNWVPGIATKERKQQEHELDNHVMGKDLEIGVPRIPNLQLEDPSEKEFTKMAGNNREKFPEMNLDKDDDRIEGQLELNSEKSIRELRNQAADLRGVITNSTAHAENTVLGMANGASNVSNTKVGVIYETKEMPSLELSLKRVRDIGEMETSAHDRNVLRHSDLSAFSRYNSSTTANQGPTGNVGSCSPFDNSSEAVKAVSMQNVQSNSNSTPPNQGSNGSSNNDMGSTTKNAFTKVVAFSDKPAPKSAVKIRNPISAFQLVQNGHAPPPQHTAQGKSDTEVTKTVSAQARTNKQVQVQHHHHHYHHHHHHVHKIPHEKVSDNDLPLKNMAAEAEAAAAPQCGSSNKLSTPFEGNAGNHYLNGSALGSDHGSNGANGCNTVLTPRGTNMESDNGAAGKCETGSVIGFGSTPGVVQNGHTLREAALNKFRHKRNERCFKKKVRYQSRKTLAEQRPRVRGQFVRQAAQDNKGNDALR